jgi:4-hydroxybenzoate polyprenyltransferase
MKIINFLIYGNVLIAVCAYVQTAQTCYFLRIENTPLSILPIFAALSTFFLYNIHKPITFLLRKELMENQRFLKTKSFSTPLSILTVLSGIFCCYLFFSIKTATQWSLILAAILSMSYVLPIFGGKRLRDLPFVKIFTIAFVWAFVTVILPVREYGKIIDSRILLMFLEKALFIFAITIPFDIRDMDWDAKMNVKTIPLSMGIQKAKYLGVLCLMSCMLIVCILHKQGNYAQISTFVLLFTYLISIFVVIYTKKDRSDYYFYGLTDGMLLLQGLLILLLDAINF